MKLGWEIRIVITNEYEHTGVKITIINGHKGSGYRKEIELKELEERKRKMYGEWTLEVE